MPRTGLALFAVAACLTACNVGLDPRNLERLDYGIEYPCVAEMLETDAPPVPVLRFFPEDDLGRQHDCLLEFYEGLHPHPHYLLLSVDGRLQAAIIDGHRGPNWYRFERPFWQRADAQCPWTPAQLQALARESIAYRVPLAWARLEELDRASHRSAPSPAVEKVSAMVTDAPGLLFLVVVFPVAWAVAELTAPDAPDPAEALRSSLLALPSGATYDEVVATIGPPAAVQHVLADGGWQRVCTYSPGDGRDRRLAFLDERLLWIEFGP